jgi:hypothetical protein
LAPIFAGKELLDSIMGLLRVREQEATKRRAIELHHRVEMEKIHQVAAHNHAIIEVEIPVWIDSVEMVRTIAKEAHLNGNIQALEAALNTLVKLHEASPAQHFKLPGKS